MSWILLFDALISILFISNLLISLTFPPASLTIKVPAAISQILILFWKYPSNLPLATYAKSKAAHPVNLKWRFEWAAPLWLVANKQSSSSIFFDTLILRLLKNEPILVQISKAKSLREKAEYLVKERGLEKVTKKIIDELILSNEKFEPIKSGEIAW